jgi:hypothetical protein
VTPQQLLAQSVFACKPLMERYLAGFNSLNHTRQAAALPNHVAWTLGHCALTMHRVAEQIDGMPLPETDFSDKPCLAATDDPTFCFHRESIAFGSTPVDDAAIYPSFERCLQIHERACDRLAAAAGAATGDQLQRPITWGRGEMPAFQLIARMIFHNGFHAGQICDLRRALDMAPVLR